jgi:hypothetical protein
MKKIAFDMLNKLNEKKLQQQAKMKKFGAAGLNHPMLKRHCGRLKLIPIQRKEYLRVSNITIN